MIKQKFEVELEYDPEATSPWTEEELKLVIEDDLIPSFTKVIAIKEIK